MTKERAIERLISRINKDTGRVRNLQDAIGLRWLAVERLAAAVMNPRDKHDVAKAIELATETDGDRLDIAEGRGAIKLSPTAAVKEFVETQMNGEPLTVSEIVNGICDKYPFFKKHCYDHRHAVRFALKRLENIERVGHGLYRKVHLVFLAGIVSLSFITSCTTSTPATKPVATKPSTPASLTPTSAIIKSSVTATNCPKVSIVGNMIYTNCVLWRVIQPSANTAYGKLSFTAYVSNQSSSSNIVINLETGAGQPADWIGPAWWPTKVWTMQYAFNVAGPWLDGISDTNAQTWETFSQADATQPRAFYRVKYQWGTP